MTIKQQINLGAIKKLCYLRNRFFQSNTLREFYSITFPVLFINTEKEDLWYT